MNKNSKLVPLYIYIYIYILFFFFFQILEGVVAPPSQSMAPSLVSSSSGSGSSASLDRYLLEPSEDPDVEYFDILMWWKMNSFRYRVISQIARDVLAIPVSTVASESTFS